MLYARRNLSLNVGIFNSALLKCKQSSIRDASSFYFIPRCARPGKSQTSKLLTQGQCGVRCGHTGFSRPYCLQIFRTLICDQTGDNNYTLSWSHVSQTEGPIRGLYTAHMICLDQSEASASDQSEVESLTKDWKISTMLVQSSSFIHSVDAMSVYSL